MLSFELPTVRLCPPFAWIAVARILIACSLIGIPLKSISQTCATQPSSAPPPVYTCAGGLCINSGAGMTSCPNGTVDQLTACSAANYYNSALSREFGSLTYTGETLLNDTQIKLSWDSQRNGKYASFIGLVPTAGAPRDLHLSMAELKAAELALKQFATELPKADSRDFYVVIQESAESFTVDFVPNPTPVKQGSDGGHPNRPVQSGSGNEHGRNICYEVSKDGAKILRIQPR